MISPSTCTCGERNVWRLLRNNWAVQAQEFLVMLKIFTRKDRPDYASLKTQVVTVIGAYVAIRGLYSLLKPETVIVIRKGFEAFVAQDEARIENPESVMTMVYLKEVECYDELREMEVIQATRVLNQKALRRLADQVATELAKRLDNARA